ncbi:MAG: T9SS type A sorting domain-containing protein [Adhaeribacter sp.]
MQKNFTHFITAINRSRNHRAILAALLLFMLLLVAKSASAQTNLPAPTQTSTIICEGGTVTFTSSYQGSGNDKPLTATWIFSGGTLPNDAVITQTGPNNGNPVTITTTLRLPIAKFNHNGSYRVVYTRNSNTDITTNPATITVRPAPLEQTFQVCSGNSTTLTASLPAGSTITPQYNWYETSTSTNSISTSNTFTTPILTQTRSYYVSATYSNPACTTSRTQIIVNVNSIPLATITPAGPLTFCAGNSVTLEANPQGANYSYQWSKDGSPINGATSRTYPASSTGAYTVVVTNTANGVSCPSASSTAVNVTVNSIIAGNNITAPANTILCGSGDPDAIAGVVPTGGDGIYSYVWESSTTSSTSGFTAITPASPTAVSYDPGVLTQTTYFRRVVTSGGCSSTSNPIQITVNQKPEVAIITGSDDVCINSTISLANATPDGVWSSSDENIAIVSTNGVVLGKVAGIVTISYKVTTPNTTCSTTVTKQITVNTLPIPPTLAASIISICSGSTATLTAENGPPNGFYKWYTTETGGSPVFTGQIFTTPILTYTNAAASSVVYYVESVNESGCASETRTPATVNIYALPTITSDATAKCATGPDAETKFSLFGNTPFGTPEWSVVSGSGIAKIDDVNSVTPTITITGIGSATIRLTSTADPINPCGNQTVDLVLTVNQLYNNALNATDPITLPAQLEFFKPATFTAVPVDPSLAWTYNWNIVYTTGLVSPSDNDGGAELNLTAAEMNMNFIGVEVVQVAPTNTPCVAPESGIARTLNLTILPVELIYLKADKKNDNVVALEWATAMEKNSEGFEVQVSQDAQNYRTLAFVASKAGGNTNQKQVYTFHDKENGKYGTRYYRLMQRDMNGDSEYFGPKAVKIGDAVESLSAFPNAFTSEVNLEVNAEEAGTMHILVTDSTGATVLERTVKVAKGNNRELLQFNNGLPKGLYFVTTRLNGKTNHIKLLKR